MSQMSRGAREPCGLARVGPYRARWDRSLLLELRMAAAVHHSRHGRHRRSQQELVLVHGDSHYCAELALVLPRAMCRDYTLGFARHLRPRRDDTHGRTDVRFIILRRAWQGALREVFWPTRKPHRRHGVPGPGPRLLAVA